MLLLRLELVTVANDPEKIVVLAALMLLMYMR
jgi:hypothetical protein